MPKPVEFYAKKYGIPVGLAKALIGQESGGRDDAVSPKGAVGRMQIHLPSHPNVTQEQARDPDFAMDYGFKLLSGHQKKFGSWRLALAAYNAGPGAVSKYGGVPPYQETQNYVKNVLTKAGAFKPVGPGTAEGIATPEKPEAMGGGGSDQALSPPTPLQTSSQEGLAALRAGSYNPTEALQTLSEAKETQGLTQALAGAPGASQTPQIEVQGKVTPRAKAAVALIDDYLGTPYVWGGENPGGFDCSGLLQYVWAKQGVNIPRVTYDQWRAGKPVTRSTLRPGDAVFFNAGKRGPGHVGMFIGGGKFIEAPRTGLNVRISKLAGRKDFVGARRFA